MVDAGPARRHLRALQRRGIGRRAVHAASDVALQVIIDVRSGKKRRIRKKTAAAILAVDRDTWQRACARAGVEPVPLYRAIKHTPLSALRDAGVPLEDVLDQYRFTSSAMLEHYDQAKDVRRGGVVSRLDELVQGSRTDRDLG